jgi:hypothetical protein
LTNRFAIEVSSAKQSVHIELDSIDAANTTPLQAESPTEGKYGLGSVEDECYLLAED